MADNLDIKLTPVEEVPARTTYVVTAAEGLFKNGQQYDKGDEVELDEQTADRFLKQEEIKHA